MSYVTNNQTQSNNNSATDRCIIQVLPSWIYESFTAKHNLTDIHDYQKLRACLSAIDIAQLEILRTTMLCAFPKVTNMEVTQLWGDYFRVEPGDACPNQVNQPEYDSTIQYYIADSVTISDLNNRLKGPKKDTDGDVAMPLEVVSGHSQEQEIPVKYRVLYLQHRLYIIVEEGYLSEMTDAVKRLSFLTRVLESAYAIYPISVVNRTGWYRQFVAAIAAQVSPV